MAIRSRIQFDCGASVVVSGIARLDYVYCSQRHALVLPMSTLMTRELILVDAVQILVAAKSVVVLCVKLMVLMLLLMMMTMMLLMPSIRLRSYGHDEARHLMSYGPLILCKADQ